MTKSPNLKYKIRKTTTNNVCGDNYALTVPREIAVQFQNVTMFIQISGGMISYVSGTKI